MVLIKLNGKTKIIKAAILYIEYDDLKVILRIIN